MGSVSQGRKMRRVLKVDGSDSCTPCEGINSPKGHA